MTLTGLIKSTDHPSINPILSGLEEGELEESPNPTTLYASKRHLKATGMLEGVLSRLRTRPSEACYGLLRGLQGILTKSTEQPSKLKTFITTAAMPS